MPEIPVADRMEPHVAVQYLLGRSDALETQYQRMVQRDRPIVMPLPTEWIVGYREWRERTCRTQ